MIYRHRTITNQYNDLVWIKYNFFTRRLKHVCVRVNGIWREAPEPAICDTNILDEWFHQIHHAK